MKVYAPYAFLNAVPEYFWKTTETEVIVNERETSVQLEVSIIRSSLAGPEFCTRACPCVKFTLLNESGDSKLKYRVCTGNIVYSHRPRQQYKNYDLRCML